jgi:hypothetical protein
MRALVIATAIVASAAFQASAGAAPARCHTSQLSLRVKSDGAGLGHRFYIIVLRNESGQSCSVFGYPGVSMLGRHKHQRGPAADRMLPKPKRFTLEPGQAGRARWDIAAGGCNGGLPPKSHYVRVIPPDETDSLIIKRRVPICESSVGSLRRHVR